MFSTDKAKLIQESNLALQIFEICGHQRLQFFLEYYVKKNKAFLERLTNLLFHNYSFFAKGQLKAE